MLSTRSCLRSKLYPGQSAFFFFSISFFFFFPRSTSPAEKSPNTRGHALPLAATAAETEAGNHLTDTSPSLRTIRLEIKASRAGRAHFQHASRQISHSSPCGTDASHTAHLRAPSAHPSSQSRRRPSSSQPPPPALPRHQHHSHQPQKLLVHPSSPSPSQILPPSCTPQLPLPLSLPRNRPHTCFFHLPLTTAVSIEIPNPLQSQPPHLPQPLLTFQSS